jgi:DNA-directed RNA polymerase specialized sigma24 family protein
MISCSGYDVTIVRPVVRGGSEDCYDLDLPGDTDPPRVLEQLGSLRPEHQLVLILKYVDELSAREITSVLDRSVQATNSLLSRARQALAIALTENPP